MTITFSDITQVTLDYYYSDPDRVIALLDAAAMHNDHDSYTDILNEAKARWMSISTLLKAALRSK